jgi:hypothetical protein
MATADKNNVGTTADFRNTPEYQEAVKKAEEDALARIRAEQAAANRASQAIHDELLAAAGATSKLPGEESSLKKLRDRLAMESGSKAVRYSKNAFVAAGAIGGVAYLIRLGVDAYRNRQEATPQ